MRISRRTRLVLTWGAAVLLCLAALHLFGTERRFLSVLAQMGLVAGTKWEIASIEESGLGVTQLNRALSPILADKTHALLLVKNDKIVYEWYAEGYGEQSRFPLAAAAKPLVGAMLLGKAVEQGVLTFDQPVSDFLPAWTKDPRKATITFRQLASHTSGMGDVFFYGGGERFKHKEEWKRFYERKPETRFNYAQNTVPLVFSPGSRYSYSGCGFYILSYTMTRAWQQKGMDHPDLRELYVREILNSAGVARRECGLSYGLSHEIDGMTLYSIGSGASMTARAIARAAQLIKNKGRYQDHTVIDPAVVEQMLRPVAVKEIDAREAGLSPITAVGWYLNTNGFFRGLPRDSIIGYGLGPQVVVISPSLDLILVRMGRSAEESTAGGPQDLFVFFEPVVSAFTNQGSELRAGD